MALAVLVGAAYFGNPYETGISALEVAGVDARVAEDAARRARSRHRDALVTLRSQVDLAAKDWPEPDREATRPSALQCALELAANQPQPVTPFTTTKEDVDRHRRIAREAIGF